MNNHPQHLLKIPRLNNNLLTKFLASSFILGLLIFQYSGKFTPIFTDNFPAWLILIFTLIFAKFVIVINNKVFLKIQYSLINNFAKITLFTLFLIFAFLLGFLYSHNFGSKALAKLLPIDVINHNLQATVNIIDIPQKTTYGYRYLANILNIKNSQIKNLPKFPIKIRLNEYINYSAKDLAKQVAIKPLEIGKNYQVVLRLTPIHGNYSPAAFDYEGWLFQKGLAGSGSLRKRISEVGESENPQYTSFALLAKIYVNKIRKKLINRLDNFAKNNSSNSNIIEIPDVVSVLGLGLQTNLDTDKWKILRQSGTIHLFSISGIHVTLLAVLLALIFNHLWRNNFYLNIFFLGKNSKRKTAFHLCNFISAQAFSLTLALICAWAYAILAGLNIPTFRTVLMLTIAYILFIRNIRTSWHSSLLITLLIIVLLDPSAVLDNGFWLSFTGVAVLLIFGINLAIPIKRENLLSERNLLSKKDYEKLKIFFRVINFITKIIVSIGRGIWRLLIIQLTFTIVLLPLLILFFKEYSTVSAIANLFAVPLISWVVVPLAIFIVFVPNVYGIAILKYLQDVFFNLMELLINISPSITTAETNIIALFFALLGIIYFLANRGLANKWLVLLFLLPLIFAKNDKINFGEARIYTFDVGAGLAVYIQTQNHNLLYDTGAKLSGYSAYNFVIRPFIQGEKIKKFDTVIVSHSDNDHSGGLPEIIDEYYIDKLILGNKPKDWKKFFRKKNLTNHQNFLAISEISHCNEKWQSWSWDGVLFSVVSAFDADIGSQNDSSCLLKISTKNNSVLLTGDIEKAAMKTLTENHRDDITSTYLLIPHHGSKTSIYDDFYHTVAAQYSFVSGGKSQINNPVDDIRRALPPDMHIFHTYHQGTIIINLQSEETKPPLSYREIKPRYWHR